MKKSIFILSMLISHMVSAQCFIEPACGDLVVFNGKDKILGVNYPGHNCLKGIGNTSIKTLKWTAGTISFEGFIRIDGQLKNEGRSFYVDANGGLDVNYADLSGTIYVESNLKINAGTFNTPTFILRNNTCKLFVGGEALSEGVHLIDGGTVNVINAGCFDLLPFKIGSLQVTQHEKGHFIIEFETVPNSKTKQFKLWVSTDARNKVPVTVFVPEFPDQRKFRYIVSYESVIEKLKKD